MRLWPALPVALPLAVAAVIAGFGKFVHSRLVDAAAVATALTVTGIAVLLLNQSLDETITYWFGGWQPVNGIPIGISFVVEPFGATLTLLAGVATVITFVFSWRFFDEVGALFHVLVLVFLAAMCGFALTGDLFNLFVFFELMSVTAFALTAYRSSETGPLQGALNFTVSNTVGAILIMTGIALLYGRTDALNLRQIGQAIAHSAPDVLLVMAFTLITCGFLIKAAVVPFHFWLADAYAVAPAPAAVLFSAVMSDLGLYAVAEIYWEIFAQPFSYHAPVLRGLFLTLGTLTALLCAVMAFLQRHVKRMLAFATSSHIGLFLIGIGLLNAAGLAGAAVYLFADGLIKGGLFLAAGVLAYRLNSGDELALRGRGRGLPGLGVAMAAGGLALATLPPFGTFVGKGLIEEAAVLADAHWVPWVLLAAEALTGAAVLRLAGRVFLGLGARRDPLLTRQDDEPGKDEPTNRSGRSGALLTLPVAALIAAGYAVGFIPNLANRAAEAARRFIALPEKVGEAPSGAPLISTTAYLFAAGAVALAIILALLTLGRPTDEPARWRATLIRGLLPAARALRALHSGHIGDYVTWLLLGVAAIAATCVFGLTL